jgi:hypothetical protein
MPGTNLLLPYLLDGSVFLLLRFELLARFYGRREFCPAISANLQFDWGFLPAWRPW